MAETLVGGILLALGSLLSAWIGWIFVDNRMKEGSILIDIEVVGTMIGAALGTFIAVLGLGGWISGAV